MWGLETRRLVEHFCQESVAVIEKFVTDQGASENLTKNLHIFGPQKVVIK
jgi:hypothetical protein